MPEVRGGDSGDSEEAHVTLAAYLAKYTWHDDQMGVTVDSLTAQAGSSQYWNKVNIKGRTVSADRDYSYVDLSLGIYMGGTRIGEAYEIIADVKRRSETGFAITIYNVPLPAGDLTWQVESVSYDDESYTERHYFGPERDFEKSTWEINANRDRYTAYCNNQFGILRDPGLFYTVSGDKYRKKCLG